LRSSAHWRSLDRLGRLSLFASINSIISSRRKRRCAGHRLSMLLTPAQTSRGSTSICSVSPSFPSSTSARMFIVIGILHTLANEKDSSPFKLTSAPDEKYKAAAPTVPSVAAAIRRHSS